MGRILEDHGTVQEGRGGFHDPALAGVLQAQGREHLMDVAGSFEAPDLVVHQGAVSLLGHLDEAHAAGEEDQRAVHGFGGGAEVRRRARVGGAVVVHQFDRDGGRPRRLVPLQEGAGQVRRTTEGEAGGEHELAALEQ